MIPAVQVSVVALGHGLDTALQALLGATTVVLLDRAPAVAIPERHRVAAFAVHEIDADELARSRQAVTGVLDEMGSQPELMAAEAVLHRPAAQVAVALDDRHPLTALGQERAAHQTSGSRSDNDDVVFHFDLNRQLRQRQERADFYQPLV